MNTFSDPRAIVDTLDIIGGAHVADLGAGTGAYTLAFAEKFKGSDPEVKIYAVDVQKNLVEHLQKKAQDLGYGNVSAIWGNIELEKGTRLRHDSVQFAVLANTLFQVEHKKDLLHEIIRILAPGGRLLIVDWSESFGHMGPKPDHVVTLSEAKALCEDIGLTFEKEVPVGAHHYGFIVRKA